MPTSILACLRCGGVELVEAGPLRRCRDCHWTGRPAGFEDRTGYVRFRRGLSDAAET